MSTDFQDIAGILTDGSGPFGPAELRALVARGVGPSDAVIRSEEELALAGFGRQKADKAENSTETFFLAGDTSQASEIWRSTQSVSAFGEGGAGAWAAIRVLSDQHRAWLSRDQFGQQPLYYVEKAGSLAFSTSLSWFFDSGIVSRKFDSERFGELVQLQFLAGASSPFVDIRRVSPGETLVIERGRIVDRLRRPSVPLSDRRTVNHEAALDALDTHLSETLREAISRFTNDASGIGCVITGDLGSTVLAVALARSSKTKAYALVPVIVEGEKSRAALKARMDFAAGLGLEAIAVSVKKEDFWKRLPEIAKAMTDPVADHAALLWDAVAQAAANMDVALVLPTGGQELFGAYGRYRTAARPLWLGGRAMRSRGHLQGLGRLPDGPAHWRDGMIAAENKIRGGSFSTIQTLQLLDIATWLPNDTILGEHQLLHGTGVAVSRPYLEPMFAGFAFALPDQLKLRGQQGGRLLRHWLSRTYPAAQKLLEEERPGVPVSDWIAQESGSLGAAVDAILADAQLMARGQAKDIFTLLGSQPTKRLGMAAWQLLYFACWYRIHVTGAPVEGDVSSLLGTPN